jgi:hypothetical protein
MAASPFDVSEWARFLVNIGSVWNTAIHAPKTLLHFSPSDKELVEGVTFYLEMLGISLVLTAPLIFQHKAEFGNKVRMAASAVFSIVSLALCAFAGDLAFRLFGGTGTFASSFLAYAYGFGPYGPFLTLSSLLLFASLPPNLRQYALSPVTAQKAGQKAMEDPRTNRFLFVVASLILWLTLIVGYVVFLRCMIFVHSSHGMRAAASIVVFLIAFAILGKLIQPIQGIIMPPPSDDTPDRPVEPDSA